MNDVVQRVLSGVIKVAAYAVVILARAPFVHSVAQLFHLIILAASFNLLLQDALTERYRNNCKVTIDRPKFGPD